MLRDPDLDMTQDDDSPIVQSPHNMDDLLRIALCSQKKTDAQVEQLWIQHSTQ